MNIQPRSHRAQNSRETILATSRHVFLRHGYLDASMDTIAQRSGVSKTTLYAHFNNKEALFNQVVVDVVSEHADTLAALLDFPPQDDFRNRLVAVGSRLLARLLNPEAIALLRLCVIEGARMPRLGFEALATARSNLRQALAGFLQEQSAQAGIAISDPQEAADLFIVLTLRDLQLEAMLPWSAGSAPEAQRRNAEQVADTMLRLYGSTPAP